MGNPAGVRRDFAALEKRRFEAIGLLEKENSFGRDAQCKALGSPQWLDLEIPVVIIIIIICR
jgi:hypothetical protein